MPTFHFSNVFLTLYTGFPEELRDFNTTPITVTFLQGGITTVNVNVGIEDDDIHEPDEFFAVRLDVGSVSSSVMLGQVLSLCRIEDNDGKCLLWYTITLVAADTQFRHYKFYSNDVSPLVYMK